MKWVNNAEDNIAFGGLEFFVRVATGSDSDRENAIDGPLLGFEALSSLQLRQIGPSNREAERLRCLVKSLRHIRQSGPPVLRDYLAMMVSSANQT